MTEFEKLASDLASTAKTMSIDAGLGPRDAIGPLLTAGIATAFANAQDGRDLHELAAGLVGFVNQSCINIIEGIENAKEA